MKNIVILNPTHNGDSIPKIKARSIIPKISSITAAPNIVFPTFVSKTCKSKRDLTVTPTDVAIKINPITMLSCIVKLNIIPVIIPSINGTIIPPIATNVEDFPISRIFEILVSRPDTNNKNKIPNSASNSNSGVLKARFGNVTVILKNV